MLMTCFDDYSCGVFIQRLSNNTKQQSKTQRFIIFAKWLIWGFPSSKVPLYFCWDNRFVSRWIWNCTDLHQNVKIIEEKSKTKKNRNKWTNLRRVPPKNLNNHRVPQNCNLSMILRMDWFDIFIFVIDVWLKSLSRKIF